MNRNYAETKNSQVCTLTRYVRVGLGLAGLGLAWGMCDYLS